MSKFEKKLMDALENSEKLQNLTTEEVDTLKSLVAEPSPWYVKALKIIKYLGAVAGYLLAGLGLGSCTHFINL